MAIISLFSFLNKLHIYRHKSVLLVLLMGILVKIEAQQPGSFLANGRNVIIDSFNQHVRLMMNEVGVPGSSLAIISNNKVVFYNSYGYKQKSTLEKVDKKTIFEACSLTKSFLVYIVLRLADEGRLDLDKPMYQYMPYKPLEYDPRYKQITPRMILSHSSGIENWMYMNRPDTLDILSTPGEKYIYSGEGYQYLGKVVESILHQPYEQYVERMILHPLRLKRTYTAYTANGEYPMNYAVGHNEFNKEIRKWKNPAPKPASGNHTTALDYAKLIIAMFDQKHLSPARIKDMLTPAVKLQEVNPAVYYGPGFEVIFSGNDTIISQGGSNSGFKALLFYSVVSKNGFVFFTNSDRGKAMATRINQETVGLDLSPKFRYDYYEQYPSTAINLLKLYNEKSPNEMFLKITELRNQGKLSANTLNELGEVFLKADILAAKKIFQENCSIHPDSPQAFLQLGMLFMTEKNYQSAYEYLSKAKLLHLDDSRLDVNLKKCEEQLSKTRG